MLYSVSMLIKEIKNKGRGPMISICIATYIQTTNTCLYKPTTDILPSYLHET